MKVEKTLAGALQDLYELFVCGLFLSGGDKSLNSGINLRAEEGAEWPKFLNLEPAYMRAIILQAKTYAKIVVCPDCIWADIIYCPCPNP